MTSGNAVISLLEQIYPKPERDYDLSGYSYYTEARFLRQLLFFLKTPHAI